MRTRNACGPTTHSREGTLRTQSTVTTAAIDALPEAAGLATAIDGAIAGVLPALASDADVRREFERTDVVKQLLSGTPPRLRDASRALEYDLDRVLTAVVLWDPLLRPRPACGM